MRVLSSFNDGSHVGIMCGVGALQQGLCPKARAASRCTARRQRVGIMLLLVFATPGNTAVCLLYEPEISTHESPLLLDLQRRLCAPRASLGAPSSAFDIPAAPILIPEGPWTEVEGSVNAPKGFKAQGALSARSGISV